MDKSITGPDYGGPMTSLPTLAAGGYGLALATDAGEDV